MVKPISPSAVKESDPVPDWLVERINTCLSGPWQGSKRMMIDGEKVGMRRPDVHGLRLAFEQAGWGVEVSYGDQRDPGLWITFTRP